MKKFDISRLVNTFGMPVLLTVLGGIMVLNPDSAAVVIARLLGWVLVISFGVRLIPLVSGGRWDRNQALNVVFLALGIWLLCNPLVLASALGRVLGTFLLITKGRSLFSGTRPVSAMTWIFVIAGVLLIAVPLSASRLVFTLAGLALMVLGVMEIIIRARGRQYLDAGDDPNIIDAL